MLWSSASLGVSLATVNQLDWQFNTETENLMLFGPKVLVLGITWTISVVIKAPCITRNQIQIGLKHPNFFTIPLTPDCSYFCNTHQISYFCYKICPQENKIMWLAVLMFDQIRYFFKSVTWNLRVLLNNGYLLNIMSITNKIKY